MAQTSMDNSRRAEAVREQEERKSQLIKEGLDYGKALGAEEKRLVKELKGLEAVSRHGALKVTFTVDDEEVVIGPTGNLDYVNFVEHVRSIPRSIMAKLDNGKAKRIEAIKGRLRGMPGEYARKKADLETKIFHCDERAARYSQGSRGG